MRCASPCGRRLNVARRQRHGAVILLNAGIASSFENQMKNDDVLGLGRQIRRHRRRRVLDTPGRSKFPVKEHRAVEFHRLEHLDSTSIRFTWRGRKVRKRILDARISGLQLSHFSDKRARRADKTRNGLCPIVQPDSAWPEAPTEKTTRGRRSHETNTVVPEMEGLKTRLNIIWTQETTIDSRGTWKAAHGNFMSVSSSRRDAVVGRGMRVRQLALIAAKDGLEVTGVDIAAIWVERAQARARAEGVPARFEVADAEALPFEAASFDAVASLIGAMFARGLIWWRRNCCGCAHPGDPRHGQLDGGGVRRTDVQERREIHRPVRDAVAGACGADEATVRERLVTDCPPSA